MNVLRLILGDQLNYSHSWYTSCYSNVIYLMMEIRQETDYVLHHRQKVQAFFAAMRQFAKWLRKNGHRVKYLSLNDAENSQSLSANVKACIADLNIERFEYQYPDEYRLDRMLRNLSTDLSVPVKAVDTEHFLYTRGQSAGFFTQKKAPRLEYFYRTIRREFGILMEGNKPAGGKWNYDTENRLPYKGTPVVPVPLVFRNNIEKIDSALDSGGVNTMGTADSRILFWPVTREQSLKLLGHFTQQCLPWFGTYEDAMSSQYWSMFHSRLSFALNTKMLNPGEVVSAALEAWQDDKSRISLPQIEGFIRQIIGWREYMRGLYWAYMPGYAAMNYFAHTRALPQWYWTGETKMNCLAACIRQSLEKAYAHHIQRLMVLGNFALLAGVHPDHVDTWYLGIYIDAVQWAEITNTRGMSQFADGGIAASKPYVSSARYINRMSDYCKTCIYNQGENTGACACPFNSMYWDFFLRHRELLSANPRIMLMYSMWDRFKKAKQYAILDRAAYCLEHVNEL